MTRDETTWLYGIIKTIRPRWNAQGIWSQLAAHAHEYELTQLALPAIRAAHDPTIETPAGIFFTDRAHWDNPQIGQARIMRPCEEHGRVDGGEDAMNCRMCLSEIKSDPPLRTREQLGKRLHHRTREPRPTEAP